MKRIFTICLLSATICKSQIKSGSGKIYIGDMKPLGNCWISQNNCCRVIFHLKENGDIEFIAHGGDTVYIVNNKVNLRIKSKKS